MQLVLIKWDDAWADTDNFSTLHGMQQTHKPMVIQSLGWLLQDDEVGISICNERSTDEEGHETYRGRTFIPRGMIRSVTPFNLSKPRVRRPPHVNSLDGDIPKQQ